MKRCKRKRVTSSESGDMGCTDLKWLQEETAYNATNNGPLYSHSVWHTMKWADEAKYRERDNKPSVVDMHVPRATL